MDETTTLPTHVAVVMDGNGRWATQKNLRRVHGHRLGAKTAKQIIRHASNIGVEHLSLFAFSTENWFRPKSEVRFLMNLMSMMLDAEMMQLHQANVKVIFTGSRQRINSTLCQIMDRTTALTANNTGLVLNVALNYGGRWEIVECTKQIVQRCQQGDLSIDEIDEDIFSDHLIHPMLPDVDLLIRTSGEFRVSNFFLWQLAYSELYFCPKLWPDFTINDFHQALHHYNHRQRRFGNLPEQAEGST